jgi:uncharacterized membrane protein
MSFESAKKYGFIASVLNVIVPILSIIMLAGMIWYIFDQAFNQAMGNSFTDLSMFWTGFFEGFCLILGVISIVAFILFFLAMHKLSKYYQEPAIFKKLLYSLLISIIAGIVIYIITIVFTTSTIPTVETAVTPEDIGQFLVQFIAFFVAIITVAIVLSIINGLLYYQAFNKLCEKSGVDNFKTAGLLYLIGAITNIVGIGAIITWIAWIFAAQGYKKLTPQQPPTCTTTTSQSNFDKIYCSYCGTENDNATTSYCKHCGKPIQTTQTNTP